MIDFVKTRKKIADYREGLAHDMSKEDQISAVMERVCTETPNFSEKDTDVYSRDFVRWTQDRGLLVLKETA